MRIRGLLACAALACLAPACKTWASKDVHTAKIEAIQQVNRGEEFAFTVNLIDLAGRRVDGLAFEWTVDWVGLPGMRHKGKSGHRETIRVKGQPGKAMLTVRTYEGESVVDLARMEFQVD